MQLLRFRHFYISLVAVFFIIPSMRALGQDIYLPVKTQLQIFLKILTFDRNLKERAGSDLVFAIIYQSKFITSYNIKTDIEDELNDSNLKIDGFDFRFIAVDLETEDLEKAIIDKNVDIIYITPLRAYDVREILKKSRQHNILTITGVPDYVVAGVTAGVTIKDSKPQILINISSAKYESINFSSQLLKLAKIYE